MKSVFVASSRKHYNIVFGLRNKLESWGIKGFYPYLDKVDIEDNFEEKKKATLNHFPEIDQIDVLYTISKEGYVGSSVIIEIAYAFAKGKEIISSEPINELAVKSLVSKVMRYDEFLDYILR